MCRKSAAAFGGVAQLGERTVRIRKVESSILFVSTKKAHTAFAVCAFFAVAVRIGLSHFAGMLRFCDGTNLDAGHLIAKLEFDSLFATNKKGAAKATPSLELVDGLEPPTC